MKCLDLFKILQEDLDMLPNQKIISLTKNKFEALIVDVNEEFGLAAIADLTCKSPKRPSVVTFEEVDRKIKSRTWEIVDHDLPEIFFSDDKCIKPKSLELRDKALQIIEPLLNDPDMYYRYLYGDSSSIGAYLQKKSNRLKKPVYSALNRYFQYGGMPNSLLPHYFNCGQSYQLRDAPVQLENGDICLFSKPGVETTYGDPYRAVTKLDRGQIKTFSVRIKPGQDVRLADLYLDYCIEFCCIEVRPKDAKDSDIANQMNMILPRRHLISPRSFKREIMKAVGRLNFLRKKLGSINYDRDASGKPGSAKQGLRGIASRYEIDSTTFDIYLRYPYSTDSLLATGRPTVYFVVDTVSGMIVGVHVSFKAPCWESAGQALFNAFSDKVEFCASYGVEITESEWPCNIVCRELTMDRGCENTDKNIKSLVKGHVGLTAGNFNAYHRGDMKPHVEKKFDVVQSKLFRLKQER